MANPNIPNLCGASPELNALTSKVDDIKNDILAKLDLPASDIASSVSGKLTEIKSAFDNLSLDLPEVPNVNFQSELTSLINDIDKTTIEGIAAFNNKLAELEKDFGETLKEKGLELNNLITEATTKLAAGGDVCALAPNIEIPAANSGTGTTTEEKELVVSTGLTVIALPEDYKEVVSVSGKSEGSNFFSNISGYKVNGRIITISKSYPQVKVKYIISLIKEKPVEVKQAIVPPEKETVSIVSPNSNAVDTKTVSNFNSLLTKLKTKSVLGLATEKEKAGIQSALDSIGSESTKSKMSADFDKANNFLNGTGEGTLAGELNSAFRPPIGENKKQVEIKVTTPENASVVKKEVVQKVNPVTRKVEKVEVKKTEKAQVSAAGFTNRRVEITEQFYTSALPSNADIDTDGFKLIEAFTGVPKIELKQAPVDILEILGREYLSNGTFRQYAFVKGESQDPPSQLIAGLTPPKTVNLLPAELNPYVKNINAIIITYVTLEKLDPTVKG